MVRSSDPTVTIVIPARNEARNLAVILPQLPPVSQVVVVDGGSVDGTAEVARHLLPEAVVIGQSRRGKGNALVCGFEVATGDVVVMFDADGSADPAEIPTFVAALVAGADFAKGTRFHADGGSEDITALRRAGNRCLNGIMNTLFDTRYTDLCYGYNAFWRDLLPLLALPPGAGESDRQWGDGFEIETVLNCRVAVAGLSVVEVPSVERRRIFGETQLRTVSDGTRVLRTILAESARARTAAADAVVLRPALAASVARGIVAGDPS